MGTAKPSHEALFFAAMGSACGHCAFDANRSTPAHQRGRRLDRAARDTDCIDDGMRRLVAHVALCARGTKLFVCW